jgi:HPt (histidine-containing phosphotransfer) domain-containing protein
VTDENVECNNDEHVSSNIQHGLHTTTKMPDFELLTGFDEERLEMLEMMLGSRMRVLQAVKKLIVDFSSAVSEIQSLLDVDDFYMASRKLHTLKGCSADLGANDISALAYEIEDMIKREDVGNINQKMGQLSQAWQVIETTVKTLQ